MSQDDELSEQQFGMETRKLEIRYRRGIYLIDITPAEGSKSLVAVIFLKQLSLRQRGTTEILERPYIHLLSLRQDLLRTHRQTSAVLIVLEDITGVGILQQNTDSALTSRHIPYISRFSFGQDGEALRIPGSLSFQLQIFLFYLRKERICLWFARCSKSGLRCIPVFLKSMP